jgi:predicted DNA-binding transcriptional regulator AlpA
MSEKLLTASQVAELLGLSRNTITAYKAREQMPEPDVVYGRTPLWKEATIKAWRPGGCSNDG